MTDFRDHFVRNALDEAIGPFRPEKSRRSRIARILTIAALALAVFIGFWTLLHYSSPKQAPRAPERKAIPVELLSAPDRR